MGNEIIAIYANKSGSIICLNDGEPLLEKYNEAGLFLLDRDFKSTTSMVNDVHDFINRKNILSLEIGDGKRSATFYATKEVLEDYIHFKYDYSKMCSVYIVYRLTAENNLESNKQLIKLGLFRSLKDFLQVALKNLPEKEAEEIADRIMLQEEVRCNWL